MPGNQEAGRATTRPRRDYRWGDPDDFKGVAADAIVRPTMASSPAKRLRHSSSLNTATRCAAASSAGWIRGRGGP